MLNVAKFKTNRDASEEGPSVGIVMGSWSDWDAMKGAWDVLNQLEVHIESAVISAHRTPDLIKEYAQRARALGFSAIIAGAGGAAHLPGMLAAYSRLIPVIGVPVKTSTLNGVDSLHSIVQMPPGIPVATMAINGSQNAGLLAAQITALHHGDAGLAARLDDHRQALQDMVASHPDPGQDPR